MSETQKTPFDPFFEEIRRIVKEEIQVVKGELNGQASSSLLSAERAAELFDVPKSWIADAARSGELASVKMGHYRRFRREDLEDYIEKHRNEKRV